MIVTAKYFFRRTCTPTAFLQPWGVLAVLLALNLHAPQVSAAIAGEDTPQEITITGQRRLLDLRNRIHEAEDRMYGLFNELNDNRLFDIHCHWEAETGTRIRKRNCRPRFVDMAQERQAEDFLSSVQGFNYGESAHPPPAAVISYYNPQLEARMRELLQEHPKFFEAVIEHHELREELQRRKEMFFSGSDEE